MMGAGARLSVFFGGLRVGLPQAGLIGLAWMIGAFGVLFVRLAFRLRKLEAGMA
jgi:hypothetical protein